MVDKKHFTGICHIFSDLGISVLHRFKKERILEILSIFLLHFDQAFVLYFSAF